MNRRPTIALLIPAFNAAAFLPRLLSSANGQVEPFDEVWVYDDCSTDETSSVARQFGAQVIRGDVNRGCSHGKNVLAAATNAEWLHFHDADDDLFPNFVSLAREWASDGRSDVVLFPFEERDEDTGTHLAYNRFDNAEVTRDAKSYAIRRQINAICGLYRRSAFLRVGGYDEDPLVLYNEDVAMHLRLAFEGLTFAAETELSIVNYRRQQSMSASNRLNCLRSQYHVMRKTFCKPGARQYANSIAHRLWDIVGGLASQRDWKTADSAVGLAMEIGGIASLPPGSLFRQMCRVSPYLAIRLRELLIRTFKPELREGYPGWRSPFRLRVGKSTAYG